MKQSRDFTKFKLGVMVSSSTGSVCAVDSDLQQKLVAKGRQTILSSALLDEIGPLPSGPYFLTPTSLPQVYAIFKAFRLYTDDSAAFLFGAVESQDGTFDVLSASTVHSDGGASIGVPSRLYYAAPSADKPLNGVRVSHQKSIVASPVY